MDNENLSQMINDLRNGNYDILLDAMYTYNADAELIEYDETAQTIAEDMLNNYQGCNIHNRLDCQDLDEYETMCEKLDLDEPENVKTILEFYNTDGPTLLICLHKDYI